MNKYKTIKTKLMGIGLIILAVLTVYLTAEEGQADGTAAVLMIPMGAMMILHKE